MAISVRKDPDEVLKAIVFAHNAMQSQVVTDGYHRDLSQVTTGDVFQGTPTLTTLQVSLSNAVDLPSVVALANQLLAVCHMHMSDGEAHLLADRTNDPVVDGYVPAVDLTSVEALLNAIKALYNAHLTASGVHPHNDTANSVSAANATDLSSSETLANAIKTAINAHISNAGTNFNCPRIKLLDP